MMFRALLLVSLLVASPWVAAGQTPGVLHIKIVLVDADQMATSVPRHVLLVSDNPSTALPRRIVTSLNGTAEVKLRAGNYTVESERPVAFHGKTYQWTQVVDISAGSEAVLELTADNAEVEVITSTTPVDAAPLESDPSFLLPKFQDSVVAVWSPSYRASGLLIDARGLIVTSQRVIGTATSAEVQLSPDIKVEASVLASDPVRGIAVLLINPQAVGSVRPVSLGCAQATTPVVDGQQIFTIGSPLRGRKGMMSGSVSRVDPHVIVSDFILAYGSTGGPVFTADGTVVAITSLDEEQDSSKRGDVRAIRIERACEVVTSAEKKLAGASSPSAARLPVESERPFPEDVLADAAKRRMGGLVPYQISTSDFEISFLTPILTYAARDRAGSANGAGPAGNQDPQQARLDPLGDFANWSEYVQEFPPVLLIRVTPKLVESFWTTLARGAARTQGVSVPPIKHFKAGFARMRAFCGTTEVVPIHPFRIERRLSETDAIYEGLYAFDPAALTSRCGTVKLMLYSDKEPDRGDAHVVDPRVLEQIASDFAPYLTPSAVH